MKINTDKMRAIPETSYLSVQNTMLYRTIMRLLYNEKEMLNSQPGTDEIYEKLIGYDEFSKLDTETLKSALAQLTAWGNIIPMQDPRRVSTIEEYKNKQYRYSLTEYSVKIERMTIELENMFTEGNTLSSSLLVRIDEYIRDAEKMILYGDMKQINEWWKNLQEDFRRLNQNYSDYLHTFYSVNGEKMIRSIDFIIHKDKFIEYLRDFIQVLQRYSDIIEKKLLRLSNETKEKLIKKVIKSELELPRTNIEKFDEDDLSRKIYGQWNSFYHWFVSEGNRMSTCSTAMEYTNEIIRKILSNAVMLMQLQNTGISRKQDHRKYMAMFAECENTDEAHCLSAHVFGSMDIEHYKYNSDRETDSIFEDACSLRPDIFEIKPHTRKYQPRIKTEGFENRQMEKALQREAKIAAINEERKIIESYIKNNCIDVSGLSGETVPEILRISILKWISEAGQNSSRSGITDFGRKFFVQKCEGRTVLHCIDGDLDMPSYIIRFEESANG